MTKKKKQIQINIKANSIDPKNIPKNEEVALPRSQEQKIIVDAFLLDQLVNTECSNEARLLFDKSRYGTLLQDGRVQLSLIEAYYLLDKQKIKLYHNKKQLTKEAFLKRCLRMEKNFWIRYAVFADIRDRGYIIKTALKFGADFRVYNKGVKPGEDHARWIVYPVKETSVLTWYDFAAKNRVAHSTKKRLLMGIVDEENSVTYYEVKWTRP